jgi:radical SAM superfamily enzyme
MKTNCILLYGNNGFALSKYAGTFRIATELRNHGYKVQCIDITAFSNGVDNQLKDILVQLISKETLWVGVSTTFLYSLFGLPYCRTEEVFKIRHNNNPHIEDGIKSVVQLIKSLNPDIKLIAGGSRRFLLEQYGFKIFKKNNDKEIVDFTNYCAKKTTQIPLQFFGSIIEGSEFSDFHVSQNLYIKEDIIDSNDALPIEVSRGCIFKCKFCSFPLNGKKKGDWIKRSDVLYNEFIKNYELHGTTDYSFSDDTYNDSAEKVKRLYDEVYSRLPFKINFTSYIRLDLLIRFPDTVKYLQESGLKSALFGIETINHESSKIIGKGIDPTTQFEFVEYLKNNEFKEVQTFSGFILGLPKDRPDEMERMEEFLFSNKNKLDHFTIEPLYISPVKFEHPDKTYFSEFDLEYEKYGYTCYRQIDQTLHPEIRWTNHLTGMTFDKAFEFSRRITKMLDNSDRFKFAGFSYHWYKSLGVSSEDLLKLSRKEVNEKYDISFLLNKKISNYKDNLIKTIGKD